MGKERNYGIDLLRLFLMYMICILHIVGQGGVISAYEVGTRGYQVYYLMKIMCYCSVNSFAFISGYMAVDKPKKMEKLVEMWMQVFFYSFILTFIFTLIGVNDKWEKADMIKCAFPVTYDKYWYFTGFFVLYLLIPALNKFLFSINEIVAKKSFILLVVLFSVIGTIGDPFKSQIGYSTIWIIVLYCLGVLAQRIKLFETKKTISLIVIWGFCNAITWCVLMFRKSLALIKYISPTMLISGIVLVILFSRIKVSGTIIKKISPYAFGIYLFQLNQVIWSRFITNRFIFVTNRRVAVGIFYVLGSAIVIFLIGLIVEMMRSIIAKWLKIPELSKKIVNVVEFLIERIYVLLK